ncbi:MAG: RlmE family RNA methyltransferase [Rhodospirillales bacterium]|jgi:23S rRNA (uridine2552-2'-O)-methyltransferase|nr:rRNA methyltransferase [Rhodospirillaceae bacterium]MDP6426987.1 RlmE family RNA methyltransferase [Rhodospirillales bacterium]MDP6645526.1 RlmE family RNA methyltransferase [Rhodospirillales bacterium]MDP6843269.1 RlmE family RNA methyltransferase [Rhodospirillales bacterium]
MHVRVKSAKGRKLSSTRWLQRQLNDPYVEAAARDGYRSRAAYKLAELNERFGFLKRGAKVIDLGAAPGGWTQIIVESTDAKNPKSRARVIAVDIADMEPVEGAEILTLDFLGQDAPEMIMQCLGGRADAVLSDMAPRITGHAKTDHLRIMALVEAALELAKEVLAPGGVFVAKVLQGGTEQKLLAEMKTCFAAVRHAKPPASRTESSEIYVIATGYRGAG